jgi:hypothetical protein
MQLFFNNYPSPPLSMLVAVDEQILETDKDLHVYLQSHNLTASEYIWPHLQTLFGSVFEFDKWTQMMDHLVAHSSTFIVNFAAAFCICSK